MLPELNLVFSSTKEKTQELARLGHFVQKSTNLARELIKVRRTEVSGQIGKRSGSIADLRVGSYLERPVVVAADPVVVAADQDLDHLASTSCR